MSHARGLATDGQTDATAIEDGRGGMIVAWAETQGAAVDIHLKALDGNGNPRWPTVAVCATNGDQLNPAIAPDGRGGAFVTWQDSRGGAADIYSQRVLASGVVDPAWPADGQAICTAAGDQSNPAIVPDGSGGAIVVWQDSRSGTADIYALRVLASGVADPSWPSDGRALCEATGAQVGPKITSDGAGGAIVTWFDSRGENLDIYVQRVLASGAVASPWPADGLALCAAADDQREPKIAADGVGGAIVTWYDFRNGNHDIFAHRVTASGAADPAWPADGRALCTAPGSQSSPELVSDGVGGAIVAWNDFRSGVSDIYAQRVLASGSVDPAWPADGRALCTATGQQLYPAIIPDGASGAIVAWQDSRSGNRDVYTQRVLADGSLDPTWPVDGLPICTATGEQYFNPAPIVPDGRGGAIVGWEDYRSGNHYLYAARVTASGVEQPAWAVDGVALSTATGEQDPDPGAPHPFPVIAPDGTGGAIVAWRDSRSGDLDIYALRVLASGAPDPDWPANGRALCTATGDQYGPAVAPDGAGGAIVTWHDLRNGDYDIYAQRVLASGATDPAWPANGSALCSAAGDQFNPAIAPDGTGGAIVTWEDNRSGSSHIYAQRVLASGAVDLAWPVNGRALCTASGGRAFPSIVRDGNGGAIVTWQDLRSGNLDIYAQRVLASGAVDPAWPADGRALCTATGSQVTPRIVSDGAGGAIVAWDDYRAGPDDIYAQRVLASGAVDPAWPADGRALTTEANYQYNPAIVSDGVGGAIVAWEDYRGGGSDIYAQRVLASGDTDPAWPANGRALCTATGSQVRPRIVGDGASGALVTWEDFRLGGHDVYAQRVLADGAVDAAWPADGRAVCSAVGNQFGPEIAPDGSGGAIIAWWDSRSSPSYIYAQRFTRLGPVEVLWTPDGVTSALLSLESAEAGPDAVRLVWHTSQAGLEATLYRHEESRGWTVLATLTPDGVGRLRYVDQAVIAGNRFGYRLGVRSGAVETYLGEVWVLVPSGTALALEGLRPNPATRDLVVAFSLAYAGDATLELLDVAGRHVITRRLTGLPAGNHVLSLGEGRALAAGVYVIRLTQAGRSLTRKAVIAH